MSNLDDPNPHDEHTISGDQVNKVLLLVRDTVGTGDAQLSLLLFAFVVACRSCQVGKETALEKLDELFETQITMVPLEQEQVGHG